MKESNFLKMKTKMLAEPSRCVITYSVLAISFARFRALEAEKRKGRTAIL